MADQIIQVIESLCDKFGIAVDWTVEGLTPVITELVDRYARYVAYTNALYLVIYFSLVIAGSKYIRWMRGKEREYGGMDYWNAENETEYFFCMSILVSYIIVMVIYTIAVMFDIIPGTVQAITIPEFVFLNEVKSYLS